MASKRNTKKMADQKHLDCELLKELECPVCMEYMESPIRMCENGHNICDSCGSQVTRCPSCRGGFTNARNFTLERIAATAIYPCKNRKAGREETFTGNHRNSHQSESLFQRTECPFQKFSDVKCPWWGTFSNIASHVRSKHDKDFSDPSTDFAVKLLNFNKAQRYCKAIYKWGKLFFLVWEMTHLTFYFSMFHFGHKEEDGKFIYEFKLGKLTDRMTIRGQCHSYLWDYTAVLKSGECVTLHHRTVQNYVNQSRNLSCEIEILKKDMLESHFVPTTRILADPSKINAPSEDACLAEVLKAFLYFLVNKIFTNPSVKFTLLFIIDEIFANLAVRVIFLFLLIMAIPQFFRLLIFLLGIFH
jgi:E3 ubiquitin-protein ligase SIAH1